MNSMSHVWQRKIQLLENIPKTRKSTQKMSEKKKKNLTYMLFILQKKVWYESQISLTWQLNLKVWQQKIFQHICRQ